jgi:hypothetical protein
MADMPGALLLRSGVLRPDQVAQAASLRERDGGSFGESLVRLGFLDEESLAEFYHRRLMITRVPDHQLVNIPPKALALLPADMAAEFRVLPIDVDGEGAVTLAMADPTDNHAVDEVTFFIDKFIVRVVATETAIRDAIERHYGVHFTSPRALERAGAPRVATPQPPRPQPQAQVQPQPRAPNKTPEETPVVLLTKVKYSDATPLPIPVPPPQDYVPEYLPQESVVVDIDASEFDAEPLPDPEPEPEPEPPPPEPILLTRPRERRKKQDTLPGFAQMTVPDPPLARLRAASHRDAIAQAVLDYVAVLMRRAAFFVMKKSILIGFESRGADLEVALVKKLVINVEAPSLFRDVIASRLPYRGPLPETPANRAFAHAIGGVSQEVLVMPIAVRDRIIAVLFADGAAQPLPDAALHATVREAGLAYERLILESKAR